jgi:hypothetical protein
MTSVRMAEDGVGPFTFAVYLGVLLIVAIVLNIVLSVVTAGLGQFMQFPPNGAQDLFTYVSAIFYVMAAGLFLLLVLTAYRSIREQ